MSAYLFGLDPGFASVGLALVRLRPEGGEEPVMLTTFRTEKSGRKQGVLAADDNVRRTREIAKALLSFLRDADQLPTALCMEAQSFPRNASNAAKAALCIGAIAALAETLGLPIVQATPQEIKKQMGLEKMVTGKTAKEREQARQLSKEQVQARLRQRYGGELLDQLLEHLPAGQRVHAYDALAAIVTCTESEVVRLARKMAA